MLNVKFFNVFEVEMFVFFVIFPRLRRGKITDILKIDLRGLFFRKINLAVQLQETTKSRSLSFFVQIFGHNFAY